MYAHRKIHSKFWNCISVLLGQFGMFTVVYILKKKKKKKKQEKKEKKRNSWAVLMCYCFMFCFLLGLTLKRARWFAQEVWRWDCCGLPHLTFSVHSAKAAEYNQVWRPYRSKNNENNERKRIIIWPAATYRYGYLYYEMPRLHAWGLLSLYVEL